MDVPVCTVCNAVAEHKLVIPGEHTEWWRCGNCGVTFGVDIVVEQVKGSKAQAEDVITPNACC